MNRLIFFPLLCAAVSIRAEMETRLHRFTNSPPALVEKQIRFLVPEEKRVSMNARVGQVLVIAESETHAKIASMLRQMDRPPAQLDFKLRHNREVVDFTVGDGVPLNLPVSESPPPKLMDQARSRLSPDRRNDPAVATALTVHVKLLREERPAAVRLRITPAFVFGKSPPYSVITFDRLATDLMATTEAYVDLPRALSGHDFYAAFFQTQPDSAKPPRPVAMLLSFEELRFGEDESKETPQ